MAAGKVSWEDAQPDAIKGWGLVSANNHYPVMCPASVLEPNLIKEIITNLRGYNVAVVCGGNGEEKIV